MDFPPTLLHGLKNLPLLSQDGCSRPSAGFSRLSNQYHIWTRFLEKMVDWGKKMKTHVSKISLRSRAHGSTSGEVKSHKDFQRWNTQNIKIGFSPRLLSSSIFSELSSVFQLDEQKLRYSNLKILGWKLKGHSRSTQKSQNGIFPYLPLSSYNP